MDKTEGDSAPNDELHRFTSEGSGNTIGSLSSISLDKPHEELNLMQFNTTNNNNSIPNISGVKQIETGFHF